MLVCALGLDLIMTPFMSHCTGLPHIALSWLTWGGEPRWAGGDALPTSCGTYCSLPATTLCSKCVQPTCLVPSTAMGQPLGWSFELVACSLFPDLCTDLKAVPHFPLRSLGGVFDERSSQAKGTRLQMHPFPTSLSQQPHGFRHCPCWGVQWEVGAGSGLPWGHPGHADSRI